MRTTTTVCPVCGKILSGGTHRCSRCGFEMHYYTLPVNPAILAFEEERALQYARSVRLRTISHRIGNFFMKGLRSLGKYLLKITSSSEMSNTKSQHSV